MDLLTNLTDRTYVIPLAAAPPWLVSWATPLWLLGVGVALGLAVLACLWLLLWVVRRSWAREVPTILGEGSMPIALWIAGICVFVGLVGTLAVREPQAILRSLVRIPQIRDYHQTIEVAPQAGYVELIVDRYASEISTFDVTTDELVEMADAVAEKDRLVAAVELDPARGFHWSKHKQMATLLGGNFVHAIHFENLSDRPATVDVRIACEPVHPQAVTILITAACVALYFLAYVAQTWLFPRTYAVSLATIKSELAQPLIWILLGLGGFALILFLFVPYNTFGEDIKMMKDSSLTLIMILGIIQGVWAASNSISEEIEGRTALTVLSKPLGRFQFIVGKLIGILWTVSTVYLVLGAILIAVVVYKPIYDARETSAEVPEWTKCHAEMALTVPVLVLGFFEATVLASVSVAISTRLPMVPNFIICFAIYALGNITPLIVQSSIQFAPVVFVGQLITTILPVLDHFNIQTAVVAGRPVPLVYLSWALVYCILYSTVALLLALILFEDRDLA